MASALYDVVAHAGGRAELAPRSGSGRGPAGLMEAGAAVRSFTTARVSLDDIFIQVYRGQNELAEA